MKKEYSLAMLRLYQKMQLVLLTFILITFAILIWSKNIRYGLILLGIAAVLLLLMIHSFYRYIYRSNMRLEKLLLQFEENEHMMDFRYTKDQDMIKSVQALIRSLDIIAIRQKNAEILMKTAEINNLQDQINPHFLYNTLEVIRGEALANGERKVAEMIASLANYFRYNISRRETFVYLRDELKNAMNYFNIQEHRFLNKISCEILYDDVRKEQIERCYIPKLILQPIIENAIYHGLELKIGEGKVEIHISATDQKIKILVADNGLGMSEEKVKLLNKEEEFEDTVIGKKSNGVAVNNIKKRLKLYWGENAYMYVSSKRNVGTQVNLVFPLLYQKEEYMTWPEQK